MRKFLERSWSPVKKEFLKSPLFYVLLVSILLVAFYIRVFNLDKFLGFWFDQGRDALVIWDFWKNGKFFLIGPSTGILGIFRGPWYYWLIAPAYILGKGDPVSAAFFLCFITVVGIVVAYKIGVEIEGRTTGFITAIIAAFSFNLVVSARWLSNPTPMFLIGPIVAFSLIKSAKQGKWWWPTSAFFMGMAMQFGRATDIFFVPTFIIIALLFRRRINRKYLLLSIVAFVIPFIPQIIFDIRHNGILSSAYKNFFLEDSGFKLSIWQILVSRLLLYWSVFTSKILYSYKTVLNLIMIFWGAIFILQFKRLWKSEEFRVLLIVFTVPLLGLLFFQGNEGNVYDYYFTGYYLIFIVLFSRVLATLRTSFLGKMALIILAITFLTLNIKETRSHLLSGPTAIILSDQKKALDWVYSDANNNFNVDVYVPPIIPYAYDYLFVWYPTTYKVMPTGKMVKENVPLLYTLYESDNDHPERLSAWLARQKGIGDVKDEARFGGITVQKRLRIE